MDTHKCNHCGHEFPTGWKLERHKSSCKKNARKRAREAEQVEQKERRVQVDKEVKQGESEMNHVAGSSSVRQSSKRMSLKVYFKIEFSNAVILSSASPFQKYEIARAANLTVKGVFPFVNIQRNN